MLCLTAMADMFMDIT